MLKIALYTLLLCIAATAAVLLVPLDEGGFLQRFLVVSIWSSGAVYLYLRRSRERRDRIR